MTPIRAVCFDLDGTLIDDDASARDCIDRTCLEFQACAPGFDRVRVGRAYYELSQAFWNHRAHAVTDDGREYRIALWDGALQLFGINSPALARDFALHYGRLRATSAMPFEDTAPVLQALRDAGIPLAVITNGPGDTQRHKLALAGFDGYFDAVVASGDVGAGKPEPAIFTAALAAIGAEAATTLHIGDNLGTDVAGALGAGLRAAWLNRKGEPHPPGYATPEAEVATLTGLLPLLQIEAGSNG
jgi:putative hydrolase of the HAD superfamily